MERIEMRYVFEYDGEEKIVTIARRDKENEGIRCNDVCEMFEDFMDASGYAKQNVLNYFTE